MELEDRENTYLIVFQAVRQLQRDRSKFDRLAQRGHLPISSSWLAQAAYFMIEDERKGY
jgi:hypothetical protein